MTKKMKVCTACEKKLPSTTEYFHSKSEFLADGTPKLRSDCIQCFNAGRRVNRQETEKEQPLDPVARYEAGRKESQLRAEHKKLVEQVREERARNEFLSAAGKAKPIAFIDRTEKRSGMREMTATALLSDLHVEEEVPLVKALGRNEYNMDIADKRLSRFWDGCIDLVEHHRADEKAAIRDFVCWLGGDLLTGHIHEELKETTALTPTQTSLWLLPRIEAGLRKIADKLQIRKVIVPCSFGNHGRDTHKMPIAMGAEHSYEWLIYRILEDRFKDDKRFMFDTTPVPHQYVDVYGKQFHFHHGNSIGYQGGVGGIGIPLLKAVAQWDKVRYADVHIIGHWHTLRDFGRAMVNGSLIGYGPYSLHIKAEFEEPQQGFFLWDSKRGKCHVTPIWVEEMASRGKR
jgi:hypothetical protein